MTYEEASKHLKDITYWSNFWGGCYKDKLKAIDMAIEALEKQKPKPVGEWDIHSFGTPYYCPECMSDIIPVEFFRSDGSEPEEKVSYCWHCGQAIDWSE